MEDTRGTVEQRSEPPGGTSRAELAFFAIGTVGLTVAAVLCLVEHVAGAPIPRGVYALLAAAGVIGLNGWMIAWSSGRAERRAMATAQAELKLLREGQAEVSRALAELTSVVEDLRRLAPRPAVAVASCRSGGHMYLGGQLETVNLRSPAVDGPTDPSGAVFGKAREGVTWLPTPETLRAARNLASRVIATEQHRTEDNPEDTGGMRI
ncbi:hypothetical protein ACLQ25_14285 [Micromonospora sp. DT44]|uniref:hypothetical protein n=1 Tax=Micromonospora sp. DT44 TaxID=3393439 RepID=UPI003CF5AAB4